MQIHVLSDAERSRIVTELEHFAGLPDGTDLREEMFRLEVAGGDVLIRAFPVDENDEGDGDVAAIHFAAVVDRDAEWYEDICDWGRASMSRGGPIYQRLHEELRSVVLEATGKRLHLIANKGSNAFWDDIEV